MDEGPFLSTMVTVTSQAVAPPASSKPKQAQAPALTYRPSDVSSSGGPKKPSHPGIMHRRSDAASTPLRPDGVFKGVELSLLGWNDTRMEAGLSYQITANGGSLVEYGVVGQYACVCADGIRPTRDGPARLVSQRWVNDCLAHGALIDPGAKAIYTPSMAQLPLLMMSKVCLYITEKDQSKFDEISEIAKLCGIRFVSRNDSKTPLSSVTHFIFHDMASINRRRDLIPVAKRANKLIVSLDWLKDSYVSGTKQDEARYDLSTTVDVPAIGPPTSTPVSPENLELLAGKLILICSSLSDETIRPLVETLGASVVNDSGHSCSPGVLRIGTQVVCQCVTVTPSWLKECKQQKRVLCTKSFTVRVEDGIDQLMLQEDQKGEITWQNKRGDHLVKTMTN